MLLDAWHRQVTMINKLAGLVTEENRRVKPSDDGMPLEEQLAHIHQVRREWLGATGSSAAEGLGAVYRKVEGGYAPIEDLNEIKRQVELSGSAVGCGFAEFMVEGAPLIKQYENPVLFLQHMLWHEGYHAALILLALRLIGSAPSDEWEEESLWVPWRGVEVWEE